MAVGAPSCQTFSPQRGRKGGVGLEGSQSHSPAGVIGFVTHAAQEVCPPTASDLGEDRVIQANTGSPNLLSQYWHQKWEAGHKERGFGYCITPEP